VNLKILTLAAPTEIHVSTITFGFLFVYRCHYMMFSLLQAGKKVTGQNSMCLVARIQEM